MEAEPGDPASVTTPSIVFFSSGGGPIPCSLPSLFAGGARALAQQLPEGRAGQNIVRMVAKDFKNGGAVVDSRSVVLQPNQYIAWDQLATDAEGIRYELIFSPPQAGNGDQDGASPASQAGSAAGAGYAAAYGAGPMPHTSTANYASPHHTNFPPGFPVVAGQGGYPSFWQTTTAYDYQQRANAAFCSYPQGAPSERFRSNPGGCDPFAAAARAGGASSADHERSRAGGAIAAAAPPGGAAAGPASAFPGGAGGGASSALPGGGTLPHFGQGHPGPNAYGLFGAPTPGAAAAGPPFPGAAPMTGPFSGSGLPFSTGAAPSWIDPFSNEAAAEACKQVNDKRKKSDKEKTSRIFVCDSSLKSQYLGDHTFKEGVDDGLSPSMYATKHFGPLLRKKIEKSKRNVVFGSTGLPASWDGMLKVGCAENSRGAKIVEGARGEELLELKAIEFFDENPPNPPGGLVRQCLDRDLGVKSYQNSKKINVIIFSNEAVAKALDESLNQECHPISLDFGEPKKPVVQHTLFIQIKGTTLIHTVHLQDLQKTEPGRPLLDLLNKEIKTFLQGLSDEADPESQVQIVRLHLSDGKARGRSRKGKSGTLDRPYTAAEQLHSQNCRIEALTEHGCLVREVVLTVAKAKKTKDAKQATMKPLLVELARNPLETEANEADCSVVKPDVDVSCDGHAAVLHALLKTTDDEAVKSSIFMMAHTFQPPLTLSISKPELLPVEIRNCLLSGEQIEALRKKYRSKLKRKKQNDDEATAEEVVELDGSEDEREQETESTCSASSPAPVPRLRPAAVVPPTLASTRARRGNAGMRKGDDSP